VKNITPHFTPKGVAISFKWLYIYIRKMRRKEEKVRRVELSRVEAFPGMGKVSSLNKERRQEAEGDRSRYSRPVVEAVGRKGVLEIGSPGNRESTKPWKVFRVRVNQGS
jgi:hypothetical protein